MERIYIVITFAFMIHGIMFTFSKELLPDVDLVVKEAIKDARNRFPVRKGKLYYKPISNPKSVELGYNRDDFAHNRNSILLKYEIFRVFTDSRKTKKYRNRNRKNIKA